jgi:hypothetical protein
MDVHSQECSTALQNGVMCTGTRIVRLLQLAQAKDIIAFSLIFMPPRGVQAGTFPRTPPPTVVHDVGRDDYPAEVADRAAGRAQGEGGSGGAWQTLPATFSDAFLSWVPFLVLESITTTPRAAPRRDPPAPRRRSWMKHIGWAHLGGDNGVSVGAAVRASEW